MKWTNPKRESETFAASLEETLAASKMFQKKGVSVLDLEVRATRKRVIKNPNRYKAATRIGEDQNKKLGGHKNKAR
jgi:hypothetical protein